MAATASQPRPAAPSAPRTATHTLSQISSGSCSTQPGCGKCWGNSRVARPKVRPSTSMTSAVVPVVPWSIARRCRVMSAPSAASSPEFESPCCSPKEAGLTWVFSRMARLQIVTAEGGQQSVELRALNSLGRHPNNSIQLLDKIVSKEHCIIEQRGDHFVLRDLGSLNGTYINADRVRGEGLLKHGDEITLGTTRARFDDGSGRAMGPAPQAAPPQPGWQQATPRFHAPSSTNPTTKMAHSNFENPTRMGRSPTNYSPPRPNTSP